MIKEENSSSDVWTNGFPLSEDAEKGFPWENNPEPLDDCAYLKYKPEAEESVKFELVAYDCDSDDENAEAFHYLLCASKECAFISLSLFALSISGKAFNVCALSDRGFPLFRTSLKFTFFFSMQDILI